MVEDWKREVLDKAGIDWVELDEREWIILLLGLDGQAPIIGEHVFHVIFFLYPLAPFDVRPLFLTPFSPRVRKALTSLIRDGLIQRELEVVKGSLVDTYSLTRYGREAYAKLMRKVEGKWLLLSKFVVKPSKTVLEDLESLKRTYNGRTPKSLLRAILSKVRGDNAILTARLGEEALDYLRYLLRQNPDLL